MLLNNSSFPGDVELAYSRRLEIEASARAAQAAYVGGSLRGLLARLGFGTQPVRPAVADEVHLTDAQELEAELERPSFADAADYREAA